MTLNGKKDKLERLLKSYNKITVALSGGVDSAFLLAFACKTLGAENVNAVTACGPHLAKDETAYAQKLCGALGIEQKFVDMDHILPIIAPNSEDRCYFCKKEMFSQLKCIASETGSILADGTNLDDMNDYRPGHKALAELDVANPLKEAGFTKRDIREALQELAQSSDSSAFVLNTGTPIWEKPAFACLASRVPYGEAITEKKLQDIYAAEIFLKGLGLDQVRVRHHGHIARIEVPPKDRCRFFDEVFMDKVNDELKKYGFKYITLDLEGYKMGGGFHNGKGTE